MGFQDFLYTHSDNALGRSVARSKIDAMAAAIADPQTPFIKSALEKPFMQNPVSRRVVIEELVGKLNDPTFLKKVQQALGSLVETKVTGVAKEADGILEPYQNTIGNKPLLDTATMATLGGGLGYFAGGQLLDLASRMGGIGSPVAQALARRWREDPEGFQRAKMGLALAGALAGGLYGVYKHGDLSDGMASLKASMTDPEYWAKHPEKQLPPPRHGTPHEQYEQAQLDKLAADESLAEASLEDPFNRYAAEHLIRRDPVLLTGSKRTVLDIVNAAPERAPGMVTGKGIAESAIKAGASFGAAYLLGQGFGAIFNMPQPVTNRLSTIGGIAAAVMGSGVLKEIAR